MEAACKAADLQTTERARQMDESRAPKPILVTDGGMRWEREVQEMLL